MDRIPCSSSHLSQASCLHPMGPDLAGGFHLLSRISGGGCGSGPRQAALPAERGPPLGPLVTRLASCVALGSSLEALSRGPQLNATSSGGSQAHAPLCNSSGSPQQCLSLGFTGGGPICSLQDFPDARPGTGPIETLCLKMLFERQLECTFPSQPLGFLPEPYCCSAAKSCLTPGDPMDCSTPGFSVPHHLLEFTRTHVH